MTISSKLYRNPVHKDLVNCAYMKRYKNDGATLLDYYRHLRQLLPIYQFLEAEIERQKIVVPDQFQEVIKRSTKIQQDLAFCEQHLKQKNQFVPLKSVETYLDELKKLTALPPETLFTHYLTLVFGDLIGGQQIKTYVQKIYDREHILQSSPQEGLSFYVFADNTLQDFTAWLNQTDYDETIIGSQISVAFSTLLNIFIELEATRQSAFSISKHFASLFNRDTLLTKRNAAIALTVATGCLVAVNLTK